ncbi:hypothetical protein DAI22_07g100600 [Oryza sativa Japonica Group]|nr:hypothetical protein DAI22_07g100600 [Oryza sativa Japonica Group]
MKQHLHASRRRLWARGAEGLATMFLHRSELEETAARRASTSSATSLTPFLASSSRSSRARTAVRPEPSPNGGALSTHHAAQPRRQRSRPRRQRGGAGRPPHPVLLAHAGPVRRFCIPAQQIHERPAMVEGWLTSPRFNNLEELEFTEDLCYMRQLLPLPPSIFRFSNTLRVAAFSQCRVPDCTDLMLQFPHLKLLSLRQVKISETSLHSIIAGCPALEGLLLRNSYGFRCLRINSPTTRGVAFHSPYCWSHGDGEVCYHLEDVIVEFAPCLEKLLHIEQSVGLGVRVSVVVAPKLETLDVLDDVKDGYSVLDFGTVVFKGFEVVNFTTPVSSVKGFKCGETNY